MKLPRRQIQFVVAAAFGAALVIGLGLFALTHYGSPGDVADRTWSIENGDRAKWTKAVAYGQMDPTTDQCHDVLARQEEIQRSAPPTMLLSFFLRVAAQCHTMNGQSSTAYSEYIESAGGLAASTPIPSRSFIFTYQLVAVADLSAKHHDTDTARRLLTVARNVDPHAYAMIAAQYKHSQHPEDLWGPVGRLL